MPTLEEIEAAEKAAIAAGCLSGFRRDRLRTIVTAVLEAAERVRAPASFNFPGDEAMRVRHRARALQAIAQQRCETDLTTGFCCPRDGECSRQSSRGSCVHSAEGILQAIETRGLAVIWRMDPALSGPWLDADKPLIESVPALIARLRDERFAPARHEAAQALEQLHSLLTTPELEDFAAGCVAEAQHQVYRWGAEHDARKTVWDWYWTLGALAGKAVHAAMTGNLDKAKRHCITAGALLANWHRQISEAAS